MFDVSSGRNFLGTLAVALLATGCSGTAPPPPAFTGDASQVLTISIQNQQIDEARIWLYINGVRRRLGDVRGNRTETFQVPMTGREPVRMQFDLTLGARCVTRDVVIGPGELIEVIIPVNLSMMAAVCSGGR